jgi:hypothetical protein
MRALMRARAEWWNGSSFIAKRDESLTDFRLRVLSEIYKKARGGFA